MIIPHLFNERDIKFYLFTETFELTDKKWIGFNIEYDFITNHYKKKSSSILTKHKSHRNQKTSYLTCRPVTVRQWQSLSLEQANKYHDRDNQHRYFNSRRKGRVWFVYHWKKNEYVNCAFGSLILSFLSFTLNMSSLLFLLLSLAVSL